VSCFSVLPLARTSRAESLQRDLRMSLRSISKQYISQVIKPQSYDPINSTGNQPPTTFVSPLQIRPLAWTNSPRPSITLIHQSSVEKTSHCNKYASSQTVDQNYAKFQQCPIDKHVIDWGSGARGLEAVRSHCDIRRCNRCSPSITTKRKLGQTCLMQSQSRTYSLIASWTCTIHANCLTHPQSLCHHFRCLWLSRFSSSISSYVIVLFILLPRLTGLIRVGSIADGKSSANTPKSFIPGRQQ
jgi:hypothetical protein